MIHSRKLTFCACVVLQVVRLTAYRDAASSKCPSAIFYVIQMANTLIIFSSATDFIVYYVGRRRFRLILRDWFRHNVERFMPCCAHRWRLQREPSTTSELLTESTKSTSRPVIDRSGYDRKTTGEKDVEMVETLGVVLALPHAADSSRDDQIDVITTCPTQLR